MALFIPATNHKVIVQSPQLTLYFLATLVGGRVRIIKLVDDNRLIVREDGEKLKLPVNENATNYLNHDYNDSKIYGDAVLIYGDEWGLVRY